MLGFINLPTLPTNEAEFYEWVTVLTGAYLVLAHLIQFLSGRWSNQRQHIVPRVFDSITFSSSTMLLLGITHPPLLLVIGSTTPFLLIAGFAGLLYSGYSLKPRGERPEHHR
jgi:hypothetical protein